MNGPIPTHLPEAVKTSLSTIVADAARAGWSTVRACSTLGLDRRRWWRSQARQTNDTLDDRQPGGNPIHGLTNWEQTAIDDLSDEWEDIDMSETVSAKEWRSVLTTDAEIEADDDCETNTVSR